QAYPPPSTGIDLPLGLFGFSVTSVPVGGSADVQEILPNDITPTSYYKQDPTTGALHPFNYDGSVGAELDGQLVTLHLVDGGPGDADGQANGVIMDPGGPGDGGGGGGGTITVTGRSISTQESTGPWTVATFTD